MPRRKRLPVKYLLGHMGGMEFIPEDVDHGGTPVNTLQEAMRRQPPAYLPHHSLSRWQPVIVAIDSAGRRSTPLYRWHNDAWRPCLNGGCFQLHG